MVDKIKLSKGKLAGTLSKRNAEIKELKGLLIDVRHMISCHIQGQRGEYVSPEALMTRIYKVLDK